MGLTTSVSFALRSYFSVKHIDSAALFCRKAYGLEQEHGNLGVNVPEEIRSQHTAFVNGSILSTAFFLEAYINEIIADIADTLPSLSGGKSPGNIRQNYVISLSNLSAFVGGDISEKVVGRIGEMSPVISRLPTLEKFQTVMVLADKEKLDSGAAPYQEADLLIKLRNYLVHYYPETLKTPGSHDFTEEDIHKLGKRFQSKNLALNPFMSPGNPFFPDQCIAHGCAEWSILTSVRFVDEFCSKMGWKLPRFESVRQKLQTK